MTRSSRAGADRAAVIGSGPNGLAAAVTLARAGVPVTVFEAAETIGGGTRTMEVVQPGVLHDVCAAIHPMALATGFFREFEIERRIRFEVPDASYANPLDGVHNGSSNGAKNSGRNSATDRAAIAYRDLDRTASELGVDGAAYARLYRPLLARLEGVMDFAQGGSMLRWPKDPLAAVVTGLRALEQGTPAWNMRFREAAAPALISGVAAHSIGKMPSLATSAVGVVLGMLGHASGWPVPLGGSRAITDSLAADLLLHGGSIETSTPIDSMAQLSDYRVQIFDTSARGLLNIAGTVLPPRYRRALTRFRFGDGATKVDFVLDGPIPWKDSRVSLSPTVHVGGSRQEVAASEREVAAGHHPAHPYVLLAQTAEFDPHRSAHLPGNTGLVPIWSYTHVPAGSNVDVSAQVIAQIERFAPGFRDRIIDYRVTTARDLGGYNRNYTGGDFSAGAITMRQLLARPVFSAEPWRTPVPGIYLGSSSTPPGPGVTGLPGWYAARAALRHEYGLGAPDLSL